MTKPRNRQIRSDQLQGVALFLFIPLVLYLLVGQPEPLAASLAIAVALMVGHRLLARPYMHRVAPRRCLWTGGGLDGRPIEAVDLGAVEARVRSEHARDLRRVVSHLQRQRHILRPAIFLPLAALLLAILAASAGWIEEPTLDLVTDAFRLVIGMTVQWAAWGWLLVREPDAQLAVPFPVHNFFLLGVRALLWVLRLIGIWWIVAGTAGLVG